MTSDVCKTKLFSFDERERKKLLNSGKPKREKNKKQKLNALIRGGQQNDQNPKFLDLTEAKKKKKRKLKVLEHVSQQNGQVSKLELLNSKKAKRKKNKKRKLNALIEVSQLNDQDRQKRSVRDPLTKPNGTSNEVNAVKGPERKRLRKDVQYPLNGEEKITEDKAIKKNGLQTPEVFGVLTDEQKRQVKRLLEERTKKRLERPCLLLNEIGEAADLKIPAEKRKPLTIDDFQHFIIYSLFLNMSTKGFSRWAQLMKSERVKHRIFVVIEGAGLKEYLEHEADLATLREFESRLEIITPLSYGGNLIKELALVPMTRTQRTKLAEEYGSLKEAMKSGEIHKALRTMFQINKRTNSKMEEDPRRGHCLNIGEDKFSRKLLLLSPWEMVEENFPLPLGGELGSKYKNFVFTRDFYEEVTDRSPMWSLDCEMCITTKGSELTRICIVNESHEVVYESLVKPHNPIVNYVTQYSGITESMLKDVETSLEDVQQHIRSICPPDLILVGQSLNGDLIALKMMHPYVIDTSVIFNLSGIKHKKTKLRILTEEFLSERIQLGKEGHSPIEDALAAMKLVQVKLQHSLGWGNAVLSGPRPEEESEAARALLNAREEAGDSRLKGMKDDIYGAGFKRSYELTTPLVSHLVRYDKNVLLVGKQIVVDEWSRYCNVSTGVQLTSVPTGKAAVKVARTNSPVGGTTIVHMSLGSRTPSNAIAKADRLVEKLMRKPTPNTLYTILLAGRHDNPGNGLMFIHLLREHVPFVRVPRKI